LQFLAYPSLVVGPCGWIHFCLQLSKIARHQ
jgi:hypothetical protein